jgi:hypothetical protein
MLARLSTAAVMAVIIAVAGVALASANSDGRSSDEHSGQVIKLFAKTVQAENLDLGAKGDSLGDQFVFSDDLSRRRGSEKIGIDGGVCTLVRLEERVSATLQCVVTVSLEDGQITSQGLVTFTDAQTNPTFVLPITGGSDDFKAARGEVKVQELSDTEANLTLFLLDGSDD